MYCQMKFLIQFKREETTKGTMRIARTKRNDRMLLKFRQASARQTNSFDISELLIRVVNIYTRSHFLHLDLWTPLLLICVFKIVLQREDINNKQEQTISAFKTKYTLAALLYKTPYCDFLLLVHQSSYNLELTQSDRTKPGDRDHQRGRAVWSQSELVPHPRPRCQLWPIIMVILIILITIIIKIIIRSPFLVESVTNTIPEHPDQLSWSFPLPHFSLYFGSITLFHTMCQSNQHQSFIDLNIRVSHFSLFFNWATPS